MAKKQKKDHIAAIHNYCDRWCERCTLSARCTIYEENMRNKYLSPEEFVKILKKNFKKAFKNLKEAAAEQGLDIDHLIKQEPLPQDKEYELRIAALLDKTKEYSIKVHHWFREKQPHFKEEESSLIARIEMEIPIDEDAVLQLNDAIEIIHWYKFFINAKTHRAIQYSPLSFQKIEGEEVEINSLSKSLQSDENGSAKVALIAIDRSIIAWESIRTYFPHFTDDILDLFLLLHNIRRALLVWHPQAYDFVRPGFDEGWEKIWLP